MKVAKLVTITLKTRVIVDTFDSDEEVFEAAKGRFQWKLRFEGFENVEEIVEDKECPYNPEND